MNLELLASVITIAATVTGLFKFLFSNRDTFFHTRNRAINELNSILSISKAISSEKSYTVLVVKTKLKGLLSDLFNKDFSLIVNNESQVSSIYKLLDFLRTYEISKLVNGGALILKSNKVYIKKYKKVKLRNKRIFWLQFIPSVFIMLTFISFGLYYFNKISLLYKNLGVYLLIIGLYFEILALKIHEKYLSEKRYKSICKKITDRKFFCKN